MTDYKLVPVEPTLDMLCEGMDVYGREDCAEADVLGIYKAMVAAAPAVQGEPVGEVRLELGAQPYVFAELYSKSLSVLAPGTKLYTAPQPAEQQPDVQGYVMVPAKEFESVLNRADWRTAKNRAELRHMLKALQSSAAPDVPGLTEALRQYQHNDGSGLVFGYDKLLVDQYVAQLVEALEAIVSHHDEYFGDSSAESKMPWIKQARSALAAYRKGGDAMIQEGSHENQ